MNVASRGESIVGFRVSGISLMGLSMDLGNRFKVVGIRRK